MFPKDRLMCGTRLACEDRKQALAFDGRDGAILELPRILDTGDIEAGSHQVDDVSRLMSNASFLDCRRPMGNQRRGDAALVNPVFVPPKRRVAGVGPRQTVALKDVVRS